jgi:hypothetical protein
VRDSSIVKDADLAPYWGDRARCRRLDLDSERRFAHPLARHMSNVKMTSEIALQHLRYRANMARCWLALAGDHVERVRSAGACANRLGNVGEWPVRVRRRIEDEVPGDAICNIREFTPSSHVQTLSNGWARLGVALADPRRCRLASVRIEVT